MHETENTPENTLPLPRLLDGESEYAIEDVPIYTPSEPPSSLRELQRLARVKAEGEVGAFGPAVAALALERPEGEAHPELRKYEVFFPRDGFHVAFDVFPMYPLLMHATIHAAAKQQGLTYHEAREEEKGRIAHEDRDPNDPIARSITDKFGWEWPYYGAVDTTPQFIRAIGLYVTKTTGGESLLREQFIGRDGEARTIANALESALTWIEGRMDANDEGFIEYKSSIPGGIENQVWRDSWDGYSHADGTLANRHKGIASADVQQLVFDALLDAAVIYDKYLNDHEKAVALRARADKLRESIMRHFWIDEKGGYFALGSDRDDDGRIRPLKVRTSNMAHMLRSRLLAGEEFRPFREAVISQLFSPEMLNISGIRTLATDEYRYRPGAYHNGSVWLRENYIAAEGCRYHGYYGLANHFADAIHMVINVTQKFPEYVRGDDLPYPTLNTRVVKYYDHTAERVNTVEQPPQEVQAWSVSAEVARDYYSGRVPTRAYDARSVRLEDAILEKIKDYSWNKN
jgi:glycogen debranching enzyme